MNHLHYQKLLHHTVLYLHFLYLWYWTVEHYPKSFLKTLRHNLTFRLLTIANQLWCKIANLTVNKVDITMSLQFSRYPFSHYVFGKKLQKFFLSKIKKVLCWKMGWTFFFGVDFLFIASFLYFVLFSIYVFQILKRHRISKQSIYR